MNVRLGRSRRTGALLLVAGLAMLGGSAAAFAQEAGGTQLGFYEVTAEATGIGASFGDPKTQPYPLAAGLAPNAVAQLAAGPSGRAQASILWPGPLLGNAGSLANVIGTPLPPDVVSNLNYPILAQASAGAGGSDSQSLGPMSAAVDGGSSTAKTALTDFDAPGVVTAARVLTTSRSYLEGGKAIAVAESELQGVQIAGVVKIASIHTVAKGTTDGLTASTEPLVTVSGVTVGDQPATIDQDGLKLGNGAVPIGSVVGGAKPALDGLGMKAFVTQPLAQQASGGAASLDTGSVVFQWSPPQSGQYFTVVLGGASVHVSATPGSGIAAGDGGVDEFFAPADPATVLPTPSFSPSADAGSASASAGSSPSGSALSSAPGSAGGSASGSGAAAAPIQSGATPLELTSAVSDRVPLGWVLIGVLGACLVGLGLHTFRDQALGAALTGTSCPLERR